MHLDIENRFAEAVNLYRKSRGGSYGLDRAMNKAMQFWISFGMSKIPRADKARIKARYSEVYTKTPKGRVRSLDVPKTRQKTRFEKVMGEDGKPTLKQIKRKKRARELRYTRAAYLVWKTDYKGKGKHAQGDELTALIGKYIAARQFSSGLLKAGIVPALNVFRRVRGMGERVPRYKHHRGRAQAAEPGTIAPEAFAGNWEHGRVNKDRGILDVAPNAFADSRQQVIFLLQQYAYENLAQHYQQAFRK